MSQPQIRDNQGAPPAAPRWVKIFAALIVMLIVVVIILHLTGNSFGPGMHDMPATHGVPQP